MSFREELIFAGDQKPPPELDAIARKVARLSPEAENQGCEGTKAPRDQNAEAEMTVRVEHGDCREVIPRLVAEGVLVDAIITDPPYGLEFMGKTWDAPLKLWETGAGFAKPGIGDRDTPWPAFGAFGAANPTCATCGGRARGAFSRAGVTL